tara:strand:+ start:1114 stop:1272 length:159 start_codon:yes stop_codon:yes gene_type:complete
MGFIQKLAKRNPRVYKKTSEEQPKYIVKDNTLYEKHKPRKKNFLDYINPKNW